MAIDDDYFRELTRRLRLHGRGQPQVVVDLERVDRNLDRVFALLGRRGLRIAVKSLPCPGLIDHLLRRAATQRLMVFDAGMLRQCIRAFPAADILLGKPLPSAAVEWFVSGCGGDRPAILGRIRWLADTSARVEQYAAIASQHRVSLGIAVELDIGMHRGGVANAAELASVMDAIARHSRKLVFAGFMGYEAHVARAPWPRSPASAMASASTRYRAFVSLARERWPELLAGDVVFNGSGSPTLSLLEAAAPLDEVALGSVLVKPSDFDLKGLGAMEPAAWIAAPVLKSLPGVRLPFLESLAPLLGRGRRTLFLYGGRWMAAPAWPEGMRTSRLFGLSSNQQFMSVPGGTEVQVDDYVYFRPTQSEAVLDLFGALVVLRPDGVERWPAFERNADHGG